jgi:hypothetical protein
MYLNRGGRKLLCLSRRVNGKPKKIYVGTGLLADLLAAELEARKRARKAAADARTAWKARVAAAEDPLDALCDDLDRTVAAHLLTHGYHRHDRGPWRKKRERPEMSSD